MAAIQKKIAIIGAGWMGIGCLRMLTERGYQVDVYEKRNDIGGVWHPDNEYAGLTIHSPSRLIEYFDFPLPNYIDRFERIPSNEVYDYVQKYCRAKNLYQYMTFNVRVVKISFNSQTRQAILHCKDKDDVDFTTPAYDYVIYTNGYENRPIPNFTGIENFAGAVIHSFAANQKLINSYISENKKITVLGGSKTATDLIMYFYRCGYKVTWLYRTPYWFFRYNSFADAVKAEAQGKHFKYAFYKLLVVIGYLSISRAPGLTYWLWRKFKIIHTFGKKHSDFNKFHGGLLDDFQISILKKYTKEHGVTGDIKNFDKNGILLKDGRFVATDVVICCTGSGSSKSLIDIEVDGKKFPLEQVHDIYRARVVPQLPNLIFTCYHTLALGTVSGLNNGLWINAYIEAGLDEKYLQENAAHYERPFFLHQPLFESNSSFFAFNRDVTNELFAAGELDRKKFLKWFISDYLFGVNGPGPLPFEKPQMKKGVPPSKGVSRP